MNRLVLKLSFFSLVFTTGLMACSDRWQSVFEGTSEEVKKVQNILRGAGISFRIQGPTEKQTILTSEKDSRKVAAPLRRLESIFALKCHPGSSLQEYFLPVNSTAAAVPGKSFSKFLMSLDSISGVFAVSCAVKSDADRSTVQTITVWHHLTGETDIDRLKANVFNNADTLGLSMREQVVFRKIPWEIFEGSGDPAEASSNSNLIIFEPFSFRVLNSEKSIAGIQFLVMLLLFLISGFTLGYWWGRR